MYRSCLHSSIRQTLRDGWHREPQNRLEFSSLRNVERRWRPSSHVPGPRPCVTVGVGGAVGVAVGVGVAGACIHLATYAGVDKEFHQFVNHAEEYVLGNVHC